MLEMTWEAMRLKIPLTNIKRENTLTLGLKNLKRKYTFELQNVEMEGEKEIVRYKYTFTLSDINLTIKVLVNFSEEFKVWKEIEVPLT